MSSSSYTIYVGNIQSIKDEQLKEYLEKFGKIEAFYHNCTRAADEWLIDYRFIKFSSDTNMNAILTNQIDHIICRIRLDIHPYEAAFKDETRLILDRKICIAHTDPKLDRNIVKKSFGRYGRIINCTCVSSGNGVEYVYIEFESVNSVRSVFANNQRHFAGRTSLAVKKPLRPSEVGAKMEFIEKEPSIQRFNSYVDTAQYSSFLVNHQKEDTNIRTLTPVSNQSGSSSNSLSQSSHRLLSSTQQANIVHIDQNASQPCSSQQLKDLEQEYNITIRQDFDEITYQIDKFVRNQQRSYKKLREYILTKLQSQSDSSSSEDGEIDSSSTDSENVRHVNKKRVKSHH